MKKLHKYDDNISFFPHDETLGDLSSLSFFFFLHIFQVVLSIHLYFLMKIKCIISNLFITYKQWTVYN